MHDWSSRLKQVGREGKEMGALEDGTKGSEVDQIRVVEMESLSIWVICDQQSRMLISSQGAQLEV
jgi:hypothetical protein